MVVDVPGMTLESRFADEFGRRLGQETVVVVGLPPGWEAEQSFDALRDAAETSFRTPFGVKGAASRGDVVKQVSDCLGMNQRPGMNAADLVLGHSDQFRCPITIGLRVDPSCTTKGFEELEETCRDFAALTKDLDGPLSFVLLVPPPVAAETDALDVDWQPLVPRPNRLVLHDSAAFGAVSGVSRIESAGFYIYLGLRAYWEAAGQPTWLEELKPVFDRSGAWMQSADADRRIDLRFDRCLSGDATDGILPTEYLEDALEDDEMEAFARDAILSRSVRAGRIRTLRVAGFVWSPPETLHHHVTPVAARQLAEDPGFCERWGLEPESFRARARSNPLLASWIMRLAGLVELEMLSHAKSAADLSEVLSRDGLRDQLEQRRRRSDGDGLYGGSSDLVDHTSFGELKHLLFASSASEDFPLSKKRTTEIQRIRNLVAHHHFVGWAGARKVIQTLSALNSGP